MVVIGNATYPLNENLAVAYVRLSFSRKSHMRSSRSLHSHRRPPGRAFWREQVGASPK
jgi:hypothetical protein